jgi:SAM-dependent methyltransferase
MSFDYSNAVEANFASNGHRKNLCLVQASVYEMPFRSEFFDYAFCLGVLQHTPDPKTALFKIVDSLKPGGKIAADIYVKDIKHWLLATKYYVRPFVRHLPPTRLYDLTKRYVDLMWPIAKRIRKIPKIGTAINWRLLITDAWLLLPDADDETLRQWAYLDIFDMLSPTYDIPVTPLTFKRWMEDAGVSNIEITVPAHIIARGTKV